MSKGIMSHDELQHIEHCNRVLQDHLDLIKLVTNESNGLLENYLPIMQNYARGIHEAGRTFTEGVADIYKSSRELKIATGGTQDVIAFMSTVQKLNEMLTPELLAKLRSISKTDG